MMGTFAATSVVPTVPTHTDVCMYAAEMCTCTLYGKPRHRRERRNKRAGENVLTGLRRPTSVLDAHDVAKCEHGYTPSMFRPQRSPRARFGHNFTIRTYRTDPVRVAS